MARGIFPNGAGRDWGSEPGRRARSGSPPPRRHDAGRPRSSSVDSTRGRGPVGGMGLNDAQRRLFACYKSFRLASMEDLIQKTNYRLDRHNVPSGRTQETTDRLNARLTELQGIQAAMRKPTDPLCGATLVGYVGWEGDRSPSPQEQPASFSQIQVLVFLDSSGKNLIYKHLTSVAAARTLDQVSTEQKTHQLLLNSNTDIINSRYDETTDTRIHQ